MSLACCTNIANDFSLYSHVHSFIRSFIHSFSFIEWIDRTQANTCREKK